MKKENDVKFEPHYSECRCKLQKKDCRFCDGTGKFKQGYIFTANGIGFYVDTIK